MKIKKALPLICFSMTSLSQADKLASVTASDFLFEKSDATSPSYNLSYTIASEVDFDNVSGDFSYERIKLNLPLSAPIPVSYTHLRAHETREDLVCRLLLEKKEM